MIATLQAILDATNFGYEVIFSKDVNHYRITLKHIKSEHSSSSVIPLDHVDDPTVSKIIYFEEDRLRKQIKKYVNKSRSSSRQ